MQEYFIANRFKHYFVVRTPLDITKLKECVTFESLEALLSFIAKDTEFSPEEIQGSEIAVKEENGQWLYSTHYGAFIPIEDMEDEDDQPEDIYQWLSEFEC